MDFYGDNLVTGAIFGSRIDMRQEMHKVIFGALDLTAQGIFVVLREFNDIHCVACWDPITGGMSRVDCPYCKGEGYQFSERMVKMAVFAGVAPVYKPSILGSGQYPVAEMGPTDPDRYTAYCEWNVYPNFERYTLPLFKTPDKLYVVKVNTVGTPVQDPVTGQPVRASKWKILTITPITGDYGRCEYFELGLEHEVIA